MTDIYLLGSWASDGTMTWKYRAVEDGAIYKIEEEVLYSRDGTSITRVSCQSSADYETYWYSSVEEALAGFGLRIVSETRRELARVREEVRGDTTWIWYRDIGNGEEYEVEWEVSPRTESQIRAMGTYYGEPEIPHPLRDHHIKVRKDGRVLGSFGEMTVAQVLDYYGLREVTP